MTVAAAWLVLAAAAQAYTPGRLVYAKRIGTSLSEAGAWAIAAGPNGSTVIAGWRAVEPIGQVPMVGSYDASGVRRWLTVYPTPGYAQAVAVDGAGSVYVAATVMRQTGADLVLLKYGSNGQLLWERFYDGPMSGPETARAVAVDRAGAVVVLGDERRRVRTLGAGAAEVRRRRHPPLASGGTL